MNIADQMEQWGRDFSMDGDAPLFRSWAREVRRLQAQLESKSVATNAAFINALHEEGTKDDCLEQVIKLWEENWRLREQLVSVKGALAAVVRDVNEYERNNNLAPTPGHIECWDSIAHAKAVLAQTDA